MDEENAAAGGGGAINACHNDTGERENECGLILCPECSSDAHREEAIVKALVGGQHFGGFGEVCRCAKGGAGSGGLPSEHFQIEEISVEGGNGGAEDCGNHGLMISQLLPIAQSIAVNGQGWDNHLMTETPKFEIVQPKATAAPARAPVGHDQAAHGHDHGGHGHSHVPTSFGLAFGVGILLNGGFVIGEVIYGVIINSVALLADAGHNLFDVLGLLAAWVAYVLAKRAPTARYTYGFKASTILAALFNCMLLLIAVGAIGWEAVQRLWMPVAVPGFWVMVVAAIGIFTNGATALLFMRGRQDDINIRGAYLHMAGDAAVAAGVVVAGYLMSRTGWLWIDPLTSLLIVVVIVWSSWSLLREALAMSMKAVPARIDPDKVRAFLATQRGVASVHDLHIWATSTSEAALTAHLVMPAGHPGDAFLAMLREELEHHYEIGHATLQIETSLNANCAANCEAAA